MPRYFYIAKTKPGKTIQGGIDADSQQDAINKLARIGAFPVLVKAEDLSSDKKNILSLAKSSKKDLLVFTRQLATLIESGVNIINSLNIVSAQAPNKYLRAVLSDVNSKIKDGKSLSESMSSHPYLFSNLYTSMLQSGEASGNIDQALKRLADFLEKEDEFRNSVRQALTYPAFVSAVGLLTVVVLLTFVMPRLITMFEDMGQALPVPTKILISLSGFLRGNWWLILLGIFITVFLLRRFARQPQGKLQIDRARLKLPLWGNIILKTEISRMMRTLSLLLSSGIPIVQSLDIAGSAVDNQILKIEVQTFKERIAGGLSFNQCLKESKLFPEFVNNIVTVGEETGTLERSLSRIAEDYEKEVDRSLKAFARLLEPVVILVMGIIVGFIVLSMLLPIFQINLIVR